MTTANPVITDKVISEQNLTDQKNLESIKLTTADDIQHLFKQINSKHSLLSILLDNSDEYYGSTIIEINNEKNYLVIDELYPIEGHKKIEVSSRLLINTQYKGAFVNFTGIVEAIGENDKAAYYKIAMPAEVEYHQRRNTYRIATSVSETIPVTLVNEDDIMIKGELRDISHGGLCIRINALSHLSLASDDYIPTCLIHVESGQKILTSVNVCHVEKINETGSLRIGAEFANISKIDRRELEHLIAKLERAIIQKIKRTDKKAS
ncbi:MAG: flagellar brake protein [Gammaproteobacteria bacterium]|jgi:c-di-GMP-binding flagellar brake protein YcgR